MLLVNSERVLTYTHLHTISLSLLHTHTLSLSHTRTLSLYLLCAWNVIQFTKERKKFWSRFDFLLQLMSEKNVNGPEPWNSCFDPFFIEKFSIEVFSLSFLNTHTHTHTHTYTNTHSLSQTHTHTYREAKKKPVQLLTNWDFCGSSNKNWYLCLVLHDFLHLQSIWPISPSACHTLAHPPPETIL